MPAFFWLLQNNMLPRNDSAHYLIGGETVARLLLDGNFEEFLLYRHEKPSFIPYFLAPLFIIAGGNIKLVTIVFNGGFFFLMFRSLLELYRAFKVQSVVVWTGLIYFLTTPWFLSYFHAVNTEVPFMALSAFAFAQYAKRSSNLPDRSLLFALMGLMLFRPILFLLFFTSFLAVDFFNEKKLAGLLLKSKGLILGFLAFYFLWQAAYVEVFFNYIQESTLAVKATREVQSNIPFNEHLEYLIQKTAGYFDGVLFAGILAAPLLTRNIKPGPKALALLGVCFIWFALTFSFTAYFYIQDLRYLFMPFFLMLFFETAFLDLKRKTHRLIFGFLIVGAVLNLWHTVELHFFNSENPRVKKFLSFPPHTTGRYFWVEKEPIFEMLRMLEAREDRERFNLFFMAEDAFINEREMTHSILDRNSFWLAQTKNKIVDYREWDLKAPYYLFVLSGLQGVEQIFFENEAHESCFKVLVEKISAPVDSNDFAVLDKKRFYMYNGVSSDVTLFKMPNLNFLRSHQSCADYFL